MARPRGDRERPSNGSPAAADSQHDCTHPSERSGFASESPAQSIPSSSHSRMRRTGSQGRCRYPSSWSAVLAGVCLLALGAPRLAAAHGWLAVPASRNILANGKNNFWDPMSLNRMGTAGDGVCGGMTNGDDRFSAGGVFATNKIAATYAQGATIDVKTGTLIHEMHVTQIHVINNHWGKFQMRLCALSSPSAATEASELSDACLDQNKLQLADGSGLWTYPKAARSATIIFDLKYRLPPKVTCERCILQWRWVTGHTCLVPGMDWGYAVANIMPIPHYCPAGYMNAKAMPPEKFWNCADIKITGGGGKSITSAAAKVVRRPTRVPTKKVIKSPTKSPIKSPSKSTVRPRNKCHDHVPPGSPISCHEQKRIGKCSSKFMVKGKYCMRTCQRCIYGAVAAG